MEAPGQEIINCQYIVNERNGALRRGGYIPESSLGGAKPRNHQLSQYKIHKQNTFSGGAARSQNLAIEAPGPEIINCQYEVNGKTRLSRGAARSQNLAMEVAGQITESKHGGAKPSNQRLSIRCQ